VVGVADRTDARVERDGILLDVDPLGEPRLKPRGQQTRAVARFIGDDDEPTAAEARERVFGAAGFAQRSAAMRSANSAAGGPNVLRSLRR
jgi:hypothetical protein